MKRIFKTQAVDVALKTIIIMYVTLAVTVFLYEGLYLDIDDIVEYHDIIPVKDHYESDINPSFFSFYTVKVDEVNSITWNDTLVCNSFGKVPFVSVVSASVNNWTGRSRDYPEPIVKILNQGNLSIDDLNRLREWASANINSWVLAMPSIEYKSVCYVEHEIVVQTSVFGFKKRKMIRSESWTINKNTLQQ